MRTSIYGPRNIIEKIAESIDAMNIHNVVSITLKPTQNYPKNEQTPEFNVSELVVVDEAGNTFTLTLFHSFNKVASITVPEPEPKKEPMDVMEALNDLCTIR